MEESEISQNPGLVTTTTMVNNSTKVEVVRKGVKSLFGDIDRGMVLRMSILVLSITFLILLYFGIKLWRTRSRGKNVRRYDVLSAKQLQPELVIDSDSEEELFNDSQAASLIDQNRGTI